MLRGIIDYSNESDTAGAILSLDQEKAFDRVDCGFLFRTLCHLGFTSSFISWVRLLYSGVFSSVFVNGYTSEAFFPSQGVRQGCPLSPLLYVLSIEVLAANLRASRVIHGLTLPGVANPLPVTSLYADDTTVVALSDAAIHEVFNIFARFALGTGAKLNLGKCVGLWLGPWRTRLDAPVAMKWTSGMIKVLGIYLGHGDTSAANWDPRISAVRHCLDAWRARSLSYSGRAIAIFSCPLAQSGIDWIQSLLFLYSPQCPSLTARHLLFGFSSTELRSTPMVFSYLLNVCKYFIWLQRNNHRFRSGHPSALQLIASIKARVSFYLPVFAKRFSSGRRRRFFLRQWAAGGLLGAFRDSTFVVSFP